MRNVVLGLAVLAALTVVSGASAQSTYNSSSVSVNSGNLNATFVFLGTPGDGDTELVIQCNLNRAQLILHFAQQDEAVGEFPITCNPTSGFPSPVTTGGFSGEVTMNNEFKGGSFPLSLTVNKANWSFSCHYHSCPAQGSATITY